MSKKRGPKPSYPAHMALVRAMPRITLHLKAQGMDRSNESLLETLDRMRKFLFRECPLAGSHLALVRRLVKGFSAKAYTEECLAVERVRGITDDYRRRRNSYSGSYTYSEIRTRLGAHERRRGVRKERGVKPAPGVIPPRDPGLLRAIEKHLLTETISIGAATEEWGSPTPPAVQAWKGTAFVALEMIIYKTEDGRWHVRKEVVRRSTHVQEL